MTDPKKPSLFDRAREFFQLSVAAWLSIGVGTSLIAITIFSWLIFLAEPQRVAWGDYLQWPQMAVLAILWLCTCIATYWTVRLWTEDVPMREFDLEEAWQAGIDALRRRGQSIRDLPLFLVLGAQQEQAITDFVRSSQLSMSTEPVPPHPQSPLRWVISEDRILLFCRDAGSFAASQRRMSLYRQQEIDSRQERRSRGLVPVTTSSSISSLRAAQTSLHPTHTAENPEEVPSNFTSDASADDLSSPRRSTNTDRTLPQRSGQTVVAIEPRRGLGTLDPTTHAALEKLELAESLVAECEKESNGWYELECPLPEVEPAPVELLASREIVHGLARLEDTNRRIRNSRLGVAPINGILVWIDTPQLADCIRLARPLGQSIRRDLILIQEQLGVIAPVSCVFDRMEAIEGFPELIRRNGPDRAASQYMGEPIEVDQMLDPAGIDQSCRWATGAIRKSIFQSMRSENGSIRPGTRNLFQLLLASRGRVMESIRILSVEAFGFDSRLDRPTDPFCLSGLFFCASGAGETQHGYSQSLLQRMVDQQDLLNATTNQSRVEKKLYRVCFLLQLFCLVLSFGLVVQILRLSF